MDYNVRRYSDDRNGIEVRIDQDGDKYEVVFYCNGVDRLKADQVFDFLVKPFVMSASEIYSSRLDTRKFDFYDESKDIKTT